jgi:hypothetical protein
MAAVSQATGRQRADSSRPVGNTRTVTIVARMSVGNHHQLLYQALSRAPGSGLPLVI